MYNRLKTSTKTINCGVPQGSILGPLLFLLYVNDLCKSSELLKTIMFADDTNLFFSGKDINLLFKSVNRELEHINEWFKANKLSLNITFTNYILFYPKRKEDLIPLKLPELLINSKPITRVKNTKFLGVIIDENITWKNHISTVENKISKNFRYLVQSKTSSKPKMSLRFIFLFYTYLYNLCKYYMGEYNKNQTTKNK